MFFTAFFFNSPKEIISGVITILKSPANLVTDYFKISNIGASLVNASIMTFLSIFILKANMIKLSGLHMACVFMLAGFSLFGKNIFNSLPIILGVYIYSRLSRSKFEKHLLTALFGTALGPLVSEISFNLDLSLYWGLPFGVLAGIFSGLALPSIAEYVKRFHKGFSLYNIGFAAGVIGSFAVLFLRLLGYNLSPTSLINVEKNYFFAGFLLVLFLFFFIWGLALNKWSLKGYCGLLNQREVENKDYVLLHGSGLSLVNMALLGMISTLYVLLVGGSLNGPVIGAIFSVVGFGAYGKNIKNVLPIIFGVFLAGLFSHHDVFSTTVLVAALLGTSLAPISSKFGTLAGTIAGAMQLFMVINLNYLHAGINLYNSGFAAGCVATVIVFVIQMFSSIKKRKDLDGVLE